MHGSGLGVWQPAARLWSAETLRSAAELGTSTSTVQASSVSSPARQEWDPTLCVTWSLLPPQALFEAAQQHILQELKTVVWQDSRASFTCGHLPAMAHEVLHGICSHLGVLPMTSAVATHLQSGTRGHLTKPSCSHQHVCTQDSGAMVILQALFAVVQPEKSLLAS